MWEDRFLLKRPITPALAKAILARKFPIYRKEEICIWEKVAAKYGNANELRGLLRATPAVVRERLFALLACVKERDCVQHILEHHPLTKNQQQLLDILMAAWYREEELRELIRNGGGRIIERFIALVRMDVAAGESLMESPDPAFAAELNVAK
jgi:hypothetical protein